MPCSWLSLSQDAHLEEGRCGGLGEAVPLEALGIAEGVPGSMARGRDRLLGVKRVGVLETRTFSKGNYQFYMHITRYISI